jgi:hypothetical protein
MKDNNTREEHKVSTINQSFPDFNTAPIHQQVAPTSEFDEIHHMMINTNNAPGDGVPHKRANGQVYNNNQHNLSQSSSNQDVAFNDSAYQIVGGHSVANMSKGNETNASKHHQVATDQANQMTYFLFRSLRLKK